MRKNASYPNYTVDHFINYGAKIYFFADKNRQRILNHSIFCCDFELPEPILWYRLLCLMCVEPLPFSLLSCCFFFQGKRAPVFQIYNNRKLIATSCSCEPFGFLSLSFCTHKLIHKQCWYNPIVYICQCLPVGCTFCFLFI